jgi:K+-transporting ATPase KdpF subunit
VLRMSEYIAAALLSLLIFVYLLYAMLKPEKF